MALVLDGLQSRHSRRAYRRALTDFLDWHAESGQRGLSKATVNAYRRTLLDRGYSAASVNQRLSAIRKLASEAADNGALGEQAAAAIGRVPGVRQEGQRAGNWLNVRQAQAMLDAPDTSTLKGLRDRALLAVLLGAGLRRAEAAALTFEHLQQREARWVIVDLRGKRGRVRSVPVASWVKAAIDAWAQAAGIGAGRVFRSVHKGGRLDGDSMTAQAVYDVVRCYAEPLGFDALAPHDCRRTFAKLAMKGGAPVPQIQLSLGHASMATTERYLGVQLDLANAPGDRLGLRI